MVFFFFDFAAFFAFLILAFDFFFCLFLFFLSLAFTEPVFEAEGFFEEGFFLADTDFFFLGFESVVSAVLRAFFRWPFCGPEARREVHSSGLEPGFCFEGSSFCASLVRELLLFPDSLFDQVAGLSFFCFRLEESFFRLCPSFVRLSLRRATLPGVGSTPAN